MTEKVRVLKVRSSDQANVPSPQPDTTPPDKNLDKDRPEGQKPSQNPVYDPKDTSPVEGSSYQGGSTRLEFPKGDGTNEGDNFTDLKKDKGRAKKKKAKSPPGSSNAGDKLKGQASKDTADTGGPTKTEASKDQQVSGPGSTSDQILNNKSSAPPPKDIMDQILANSSAGRAAQAAADAAAAGTNVKTPPPPQPAGTNPPAPKFSEIETKDVTTTATSGENPNPNTPTPDHSGPEFGGDGYKTVYGAQRVAKGAAIANQLSSDLGISSGAAAGILGNIMNEGMLNGSVIEGQKNGGSLLPDAMKKRNWGGRMRTSGYGWGQWTSPDRQRNLYSYARAHGVNPDTTPLPDSINYGFMIEEMSKLPAINSHGFSWPKGTTVLDAIKAEEAKGGTPQQIANRVSDVFLAAFENPKYANFTTRRASAQKVLNAMGR